MGTSSSRSVDSPFGKYLRSQRKLAQLTLRELSELTDISNPYLSQIERGLHQPSVKVVRSIADALNLSAETMLAQAAGIKGTGAKGAGDKNDSSSVKGDATEVAIRNDERLSDDQKTAMLTILRNFLGE